MPQPTLSDVHVNAPLTNISIAFMQDATMFVADQVFPTVSVAKQSDRYYTYDRGMFNRDEAEKRALATESAGGGYTVDSTPTYFCEEYAYHKDVPDQVRKNADTALNPDRESSMFVTQILMIRKEKVFVTNYMTGGIWTNDYDGVSGVPSTNETRQWSDYTNSTPITDVKDAATTIQKSTGFRPNVLVMGQEVWDKLSEHPEIVDRIKYGQTPGSPAIVTKQAVAALMEIDRIVVAGAIENTANEGATNAHDFIIGKKALLAYATPTPGLMTPSAGYTFSWSEFFGSQGSGARILKYRMDPIKSDRIEGEMCFDLKLVAADLGFFWDTIVA